MKSLYRPDAVKYAARRLDGEVLIGAPVSWRLVSAGAAAVIMLIAVFCGTVSYTQKEQVRGEFVLSEGGAYAYVPAGGGIWSSIASDGQRVRRGETIGYVMSPDDLQGENHRLPDNIRAPITGDVAAMFIQGERRVQGGEQLALILPPNPMVDVELFASPSVIGSFRVGDRVSVRVASGLAERPEAQEGIVSSISQIPVSVGASGTIIRQGGGLYRVRARISRSAATLGAGEPKALVGMPVIAEIPVARKTILQWMLTALTEVGRER